MKHPINLLLMIILFQVSLFAQSKEDEVKDYNLGEVVVTAQKECIVKSATIIDVSSEIIQSVSGVDPTSSLDLLPGIHISGTSKNESKIYMRGYDQRQISIFLDGVPIYEPYSGFIDLSNLPVASIEKITVSKGMPSILYGPNSMAGSINFITKHGSENFSADLNLERGFGTNLSAGISGQLGLFNYSFNAGYYQSDGFDIPSVSDDAINEDGGRRDNSQFDKLGGMFKVSFSPFHNLDVAYSLMYVDNEKGIPTDIYTGKPKYWRYTEWKKDVHNVMVRAYWGTGILIRANMFYENFDNVLDSFDDNTYTTQVGNKSFHSVYDDNSFGANINASLITSLPGLTRLAFQFKRDVHKESGSFNEPFSEYRAETISAGIEQEIKLVENFGAIAGMNYDYLNPDFANGNEVRASTGILNGHVGFYFAPSDAISLHANISKKSRFPTLKELYTETSGRDVANPNLEVEKSLNTEIGVDYNFSNAFSCQLNFFYNNVDNLINLVYLADGLRQYQNIGEAEFKGIEFGALLSADNLNVGLNYTYLNSKNKSEDRESENLEYRPEHVLSLLPEYQFNFGLKIRGELTYLTGRYGVDSNNYEMTEMESYILTNIFVSKNLFNNLTLYVRLNNLFDEYYEEEFGFPQPGREMLGGINIIL